jgi:hypothetical protein
MKPTDNNANTVFRNPPIPNQCTYNINFHLPIPGSTSSTEYKSSITTPPPKIHFHLPIPGSFSTPEESSTVKSFDSTPISFSQTSMKYTNTILTELQSGYSGAHNQVSNAIIIIQRIYIPLFI